MEIGEMRLKLRLRRIPRPLARLAILILWVWAKSLRVKVVDPVGLTRGEWHPPCIFVIWHNRLVLAPLLAPPRARAWAAMTRDQIDAVRVK